MDENIKILIVDDDEVDRMAVRRALQKGSLNITLCEAENSAAALEKLFSTPNNQNFDVILLDYYLPDSNGLNLIEQINELNLSIPLIVLTGQGDEEIAVEIMKAGAADYLSKSRVSPQSLIQTISSAIRINRAEKAAKLANQRLRATNELLMQKNRELKLQQQQIQLQNIQLQEASRLKSEFLATMSHELRTPMNAIMGFSQLLLRQYPDPLSEQQLNIVGRIFNNSQNLLEMINELLDFSKIEAGKFELNFREFDLDKLVCLTVEELRSLAVQKKIELKTDINLNNPTVFQDYSCLKRILINLLSNAIKFTNQGGVRVKVWEFESENKIAIAVEDTGIGIEKDNFKRIFEAFRQADQSISRAHTGTGLGLAITDSLTKMLQGTITLESEVGVGSVFCVKIPRKAYV
ncbi:hybrid sensor histidine kinase/response regulator [Myxosarcina sp. GI1]|uniref:ATP-binding response regulator n=1 Tax=Myxosarcina sp. GI1 TaxID=1541065 RepID=UPI000564D3CA|nr:response regulator [Myxosarcina sp. GI1]